MSVITDVTISVHASGVSPNSSSLGTGVSADRRQLHHLRPRARHVQSAGNNNGAAGYVIEYYNDKHTWDLADTVDVSAGQTTPGIDFNLEAGGAISGHVFKADGVSVITDVTISVHADGVSSGSSSRGTWVSQTDGSYTISGLAPGTYKVQGNNNRIGGYISEYYNNKRSWDQADIVTVVASQTTANIDFALKPGGAISGHVFEQDGVTPIAGAHLAAHGPDGRWNYFADTSPDGSYTIRGMPSNTYQIKVEALGYTIQWYNDRPTPGNADWVTVVVPDPTTGIDFKLKPGGAIAGRVFKADGVTPVNDADIQVCAEPTAPNLVGNCSWISQPSGSYTIPGLTPNVAYKVRANNNLAPGYVAKYYNNKYSWDTADTVVTVAKQTTKDIDFALEPDGAVSGRVFEQDGVTPVANACVNVSATAPDWNQVAGFCCTGSDGRFTINGLAPGQVYLRTHANCQGAHPDLQDEWYASGGSTADGSRATVIAIVSGQTRSGINFALDRSGVIRGTVYNADRSIPVGRAGIGVSPSGGNAWNWRAYCADEDGRFSIPVDLGSYKVFTYSDSRCGSNHSYLREFWREKTSWDAADVVTLSTENPEAAGIDFTLEPGGSISGHVYESDGVTPMVNARRNGQPL